VSVIIPVRNAASTIEEQLEALSQQTYRGAWEVIVADNGSSDATEVIVRNWAERLPGLNFIDASDRPGASHARNRGAATARGEFLAFCDADDVVSPQWLESLVLTAADFDVVTGRQDETTLNAPVVQTWRQPRARGLPKAGFLAFVPSCNVGVWADVFESSGGYSESYRVCEDVEWSWRVQLDDFTLGFAPGAVIHYRYRTTAREIARQAYASGRESVHLYRDYRELGFRRRPVSLTLRTWVWLVIRLPYLGARHRRPIWVRRGSEALGRLAGSIRFRVLFL